MSAYEFSTKDDDANVKIRMLPHRYVRVKRDGKEHLLQLRLDYAANPATGKREKKWVSVPDGEMWVPDRIAKELTLASPDGARYGVLPMAEVVETRTSGKTRRPAQAGEDGPAA